MTEERMKMTREKYDTLKPFAEWTKWGADYKYFKHQLINDNLVIVMEINKKNNDPPEFDITAKLVEILEN